MDALLNKRRLASPSPIFEFRSCPTASIFFLISSASSFVTPFLVVFGAFASAFAQPGLVRAPRREPPYHSILFSPIPSRLLRTGFLSATELLLRQLHPAAGPRHATGAAALTPHFSSSSCLLTAIPPAHMLLSCSPIFLSLPFYFLQLPLRNLSGKLRPIVHSLTVFRSLPTRHREAEKLFTRRRALRGHPPFLPSRSISAKCYPVVQYPPIALRETRTVPSNLRLQSSALAGPPAFPICRGKSPGRQSRFQRGRFNSAAKRKNLATDATSFVACNHRLFGQVTRPLSGKRGGSESAMALFEEIFLHNVHFRTGGGQWFRNSLKSPTFSFADSRLRETQRRGASASR